MVKLTQSEKKVYDYICSVLSVDSLPPSVRDIRDSLGFASTSTVHLYLSRLEEKGLIRRESGKSRAITLINPADTDGIPLVGKVRAGLPILAEENFDGFVECYSFFKNKYKKQDLFALTVVGDSMIEAGILEGDTVVVLKTPEVSNGQIVVALIGDDATVKTFYNEGDHIRLQPENKTMKPIITKELTVLGRVIACIRNY